jgi:hypothetical protein
MVRGAVPFGARPWSTCPGIRRPAGEFVPGVQSIRVRDATASRSEESRITLPGSSAQILLANSAAFSAADPANVSARYFVPGARARHTACVGVRGLRPIEAAQQIEDVASSSSSVGCLARKTFEQPRSTPSAATVNPFLPFELSRIPSPRWPRVVRVGGFPPPRHPQSTHPVDETGCVRRIQLRELGAGVAAATTLTHSPAASHYLRPHSVQSGREGAGSTPAAASLRRQKACFCHHAASPNVRTPPA